MTRRLMMVRMILVWALALLTGQAALAQSCAIPPSLPAAQPEAIPAGQSRTGEVTGHILALSWSPQFCRTHSGERFDTQCGAQKFGFILHGLWPDGQGRASPQYCKPVGAIPATVVRQSFCATPSVDLQSHEWAKHGSCITTDAATYFRVGTSLFNAVKIPDMDGLSRARPSVGAFVTALVAANPGLRADMFSIDTGKGGWLQEVRLCLDKTYHPRRCPSDLRGANPRSALKIWRNVK
ncbi:MAG: ribonuclease T2 family protein [Sphingomonadaceae bacterium]